MSKCIFEHEDLNKICLASLIGGAPAIAGTALYMKDKSGMDWWKVGSLNFRLK